MNLNLIAANKDTEQPHTATFFPSFNWSYLQTVWSAVNLKYNPYLLYIAFWFANRLQEYETTAVK